MTTIDSASAQRKEDALRILHISNRVSTRGGADQYLLGLVSLQQRQHAVTVACGRVDADVRPGCTLEHCDGLASRTAMPVELSPLLDRVKPEIVHVHNIVNPSVLNALKGLPVLVTIQDHRFFCPGRGKWTLQEGVCSQAMSEEACHSCFEDTSYFEGMMELTRNRLEALLHFPVTVLSQYMKRELIAAGLQADSITVIPPFVHDLPQVPEPITRNTVLFAGRLVAAKGVHDAAAAWRTSGTDLPLVFAGTGSERSALEAKGHQVLGWLNREQLARAYAQAAVVVMPSRWQEPFGIVGLEALSMGTPVVAWDSGGICEWINAERMVPWGDIDALGSAILNTIGTSAQLPLKYEPAAIATQIETLYAKITG